MTYLDEWYIRVVGRTMLRWPDGVVALVKLTPYRNGSIRWIRRLWRLFYLMPPVRSTHNPVSEH